MSDTEFNPLNYESKWEKKWLEDKIYKTPDFKTSGKKEKFYSLYSFPYPSGAGLHVGHVEGMVANDIVARYWRMKGRNVTLPMGWDSFGLPAENYAIKTGTPPNESTEEAVKTFISQINNIGISVDWEKEVGAHRPDYYRWTQWIFLQLYKNGLAYKKKAPVNWCPKDQTGLAAEQVINGHCERCDTLVVQKDLEQWFFKITDFADRLDADLDKVDWPESTKTQQRNWIGRSVGAEIIWQLDNPETKENLEINTFTTRFDTIPGPTFMVLAPEYANLDKLVTSEHKDEVAKYIETAKNKTDLERQANKEKTGVFTGSYAINPYNDERVPIYVADYVLGGYGTGAVMGMPGHDQRDWEFAKKFNLPIKYTMKPKDGEIEEGGYYDGEGYEINSGEFDGLFWTEARDKIMEKLEKEGKAIKKTNYKLRDWLVSRQRYWGCPIPIVYDPQGNPHPIDEKDLPLVLPTDVDFLPTGESPIKRSESFKKLAEDRYGKGWYFEADTMDTFVDSSWYFFRFCDAKDDEKWSDSEAMNYWLPTDLYMIGAEHTVLHLMYSRFFTKFFFDQGWINFDEPFYFMRHMGTILGPDGRKMSKRWGNVINPDDEIKKFGADAVRMYEMFMGPIDESKPWNDKAESGVYRFLNRVWSLKDKIADEESEIQKREVNKLIKKVSSDIENLSFNTSVAKFMEFTNFLTKEEKISKSVWEIFLKLLAPFAPFISEELWSQLGNEYSIHTQTWPEFDESLVKQATTQVSVQIAGKFRGTVEVDFDADEATVKEKVMSDEKLKRYITSEPKKIIFVQNRVINFIL